MNLMSFSHQGVSIRTCPAVRREAVAHLQVTYEVSERRTCSALGADRASIVDNFTRECLALVADTSLLRHKWSWT